MKILIVDDSRAMRMIVSRALRQAGFEGHSIEQAGNGIEALALIESKGSDLILCDWNMPEMNGLELLKALKAKGTRTHFGFVTSETNTEQRKMAFDEGAEFMIGKPFTPEKLRQTLAPLLS